MWRRPLIIECMGDGPFYFLLSFPSIPRVLSFSHFFPFTFIYWIGRGVLPFEYPTVLWKLTLGTSWGVVFWRWPPPSWFYRCRSDTGSSPGQIPEWRPLELHDNHGDLGRDFCLRLRKTYDHKCNGDNICDLNTSHIRCLGPNTDP